MTKHSAGPARLELNLVRNTSEEVALRLLARTISEIGGNSVPRLHKVESLYQRLFQHDDGEFKSTTVGGTVFFKTNADDKHVWIFREIGRGIDALSICPNQQVIWDGRFCIELSKDAPEEVKIAPLKNELDELRESLDFPNGWPKKVFFATPVCKWSTRRNEKIPGSDKNSRFFVQGISQDKPTWLNIGTKT